MGGGWGEMGGVDPHRRCPRREAITHTGIYMVNIGEGVCARSPHMKPKGTHHAAET